jgi:hypothetical protein
VIQTLATIEADSHFSAFHALCRQALNYLFCIKTLFFNPIVCQICIVCEKELGISLFFCFSACNGLVCPTFRYKIENLF